MAPHIAFVSVDRCWIAADTLAPSTQAELIQANSRHKAKDDKPEQPADLTDTISRLSV